MKELIRNEMVACTWKVQNTDLSTAPECSLRRTHFATRFEKEPTNQEQTNEKNSGETSMVNGQVVVVAGSSCCLNRYPS